MPTRDAAPHPSRGWVPGEPHPAGGWVPAGTEVRSQSGPTRGKGEPARVPARRVGAGAKRSRGGPGDRRYVTVIAAGSTKLSFKHARTILVKGRHIGLWKNLDILLCLISDIGNNCDDR